MVGPGISLSIQNCNSLNVVSSINNQDLKISAIMGYKSDIILLSDVRLNGRDHTVSEKIRLNYTMHFNSRSNSRGVAILFNNDLVHEVLDTYADPQENILLLRTKVNNFEMIIGSIYGPNLDIGCAVFFDLICTKINSWGRLPCVIGGDWNATYSNLPLNENLDVLFMRNIPSRVRSDLVRDLCENLDLTDPFRTLHPESRDFTFVPSGTLRTNRSRIDYFLISSGLYNNLESCNIAQGYCSKTFDNKPVFLSL